MLINGARYTFFNETKRDPIYGTGTARFINAPNPKARNTFVGKERAAESLHVPTTMSSSWMGMSAKAACIAKRKRAKTAMCTAIIVRAFLITEHPDSGTAIAWITAFNILTKVERIE